MINAVKRDIPDYLLKNGKEVYQGKCYMDGKYIQKASPKTRIYEKPQESKIVASIALGLPPWLLMIAGVLSFPLETTSPILPLIPEV